MTTARRMCLACCLMVIQIVEWAQSVAMSKFCMEHSFACSKLQPRIAVEL